MFLSSFCFGARADISYIIIVSLFVALVNLLRAKKQKKTARKILPSKNDYIFLSSVAGALAGAVFSQNSGRTFGVPAWPHRKRNSLFHPAKKMQNSRPQSNFLLFFFPEMCYNDSIFSKRRETD